MDRASILEDYVQAIVLFGSEASNAATDDSDFDFLVIERTTDSRRQRGIKYQVALRPRPIAADILVRTPDELRQAVLEGHPVFQEILQKGRWIYGEPRTLGIS